MRFFSIVTAVLVSVALYLIVFERDRLLGFARNETAPAETAQTDPATKAEPSPHRVAVVVATSTATQIDTAISLRGQTEAVRRVDVQAETSGRVISAPLRKGTVVKEGDVLCQIDPGTRGAQLTEAKARLAEAEISNTAASRLAEGGFASETRAVGALATLESARTAVEAAETEIERLTIAAPFGGILESDTAELGSLLQTGAHCATILQLDPIKIVAYVPETLVDSIQIGADAQARLSSGRDVRGQVIFLSRSADQATRTFLVEVTAANPDLAIRDGQSADISISAQGAKAHKIPASALTLDNEGTMGVRLVDDTDTVFFAPVRLLRDTPDGVVITGLPDTARVIIVGQEFVTEGVKVTVTEAESAS